MRLKENQVKLLCQKVLQTLRSGQLVVLKKSDTEILHRMEQIFLADLRVEDQINRDAEALLSQYERQMGSQIDREKMFQMIKKQLIKDRKVIV